MAAVRKIHKQNGYGEKQTVKIITVDKDRRRVECAMRDGAMIWAAVWETDTTFRWPEVGETWTVRMDTGVWRLDKIVQSPIAEEESTANSISLKDLPEGDSRIVGNTVHVGRLSIEGHALSWNWEVPDEGTWNIGDVVFNTTPESGGTVGWVCIKSGSPGEWKSFGTVS